MPNHTQVIVPLADADAAGLDRQAAQAAAAGADLVELRLDTCLAQGLPAAEGIAWIARSPLPVLLTIRHACERGSWDGDESVRAGMYRDGLAAGAAWFDVELARWPLLAPQLACSRNRLILSFHDFDGPGGDLPGRIRAMRAAGCAVAKVAVTARDAADLAPVRTVVDGANPVIALAMGEHGLPSRLLAGAWGAWGTFARLPGSAGSAPGQPTVDDLLGRYRLRAQGPSTRVYGVIGSPIAHSLSPHIHNACLAADGRDAVYVPFRVEDAPAFWAACGAWIAGLSITIPHKHALQIQMSHLEPLCDVVGAMNTIYRAGDDTVGANTDADAIARCLERTAGNLAGKRVLVLGAGGVSRAIACAVRRAGAACTIANRTAARADELAQATGSRAVAWDALGLEAYDCLVNGTSLGMGKPEETPWPFAHRPGTVVFDTVYTPLETRLIREAQAAGCRTVLGLEMFIDQAEGQYRRWFGAEPPAGLMREVALRELDRRG